MRAVTPAQKRRMIDLLLGLWLERPTERLGQFLLNSIPAGVPRNGTSADEILAEIERKLYNAEDFELIRLVTERLVKNEIASEK